MVAASEEAKRLDVIAVEEQVSRGRHTWGQCAVCIGQSADERVGRKPAQECAAKCPTAPCRVQAGPQDLNPVLAVDRTRVDQVRHLRALSRAHQWTYRNVLGGIMNRQCGSRYLQIDPLLFRFVVDGHDRKPPAKHISAPNTKRLTSRITPKAA